MPLPFITIDDFSIGVVKDTTRNSGFETMFACDPYRDPGVFRPSKKTVAAGDDSLLTTNTDYIQSFEIHTAPIAAVPTTEIYGRGNGFAIYRLDSATDTWVSDFTSAGLAGNGTKLIKSFGDSLYFSVGNDLGRLNGDPTNPANWVSNYQVFPASAGSGFVNAIQDFAGSLYVGMGRNVGKLDPDEVSWDASSLVLPEWAKVIDITTWNNFLAISYGLGHQSSNTQTKSVAYVALWDGISEFPSQIIPVDGVMTSMLNYNNRLAGFVKGRMYVFNGSDFEVQKQLQGDHFDDSGAFPGDYADVTGSVLYKENLLFMQSNNIGSNNSIKGGVWTFGRTSARFPFSSSHSFVARTGEYGQNAAFATGGVFVWNAQIGDPSSQFENVYFSYRDDAQTPDAYNVDRLDLTEGYASETYLVTVPYEISANEAGKIVKGIKLEFAEAMNVSAAVNEVTVSYRVDDDIDHDDDTTNWTVLGTIDNDPNANNNMKEILYGIYEKPFKIQFKFELTANGTGADRTIGVTRLHIY